MKVLIADDEAKIRRGLASLVRSMGKPFEVVAEAADGEAALAAAAALSPDIFLVDINMPFLNGLEFIRRLSESCPGDRRVIVVSGYDDFEYARRSVGLGVFEYVLKPVEPEALEACIRRAADDLSLARKDDAYLQWARGQISRDLESVRSRFIRDWCDQALSASEIGEYRTFLDLRFGPSVGIVAAAPPFPEGGNPASGVRALAEQIVDRRALTRLVREAAAPLTPLGDYTDETGRIVVLTETCGGDLWSDLPAELIERALRATGRPLRVAQATAPATVEGPREALDQLEESFAEDGDFGALSAAARAFVETNYFNPSLSLEELAQALKVSPGYASRVLKRSTGFSFSVFLNRVRVARAAALMNDPTVRLAEVAELVGYSSPHYFSRAFKRVLGVSPARVREGELEP